MGRRRKIGLIVLIALIVIVSLSSASSSQTSYDIVILNGRVIDPESRSDSIRTALELEVGTGDIDAWYAQREQKSLINYGVSAGHLAARMAAMKEPVTFLPTGVLIVKDGQLQSVCAVRASVN